MKNKSTAIIAAACSALVFAGCSPKTESPAETPAATSSSVTVTAAQRERLHVQTVKPVAFHRTIETTGTVGFDGDHATTVLAPISGPASRLLVSLGAQVKAGDALALVDSPDYATAISGYRKAVVTAKNLRRIADLDKQLFDADAIARRDLEQAQTDAVNGEADRDAGLQQLRSIGVPDEAVREIQEDRPTTAIAGVIRSPLAGTVVEKLITPGQLLQAGTTPCFTVADLSQVWVSADIFEAQLASVAVGDSAEVVTSAATGKFSRHRGQYLRDPRSQHARHRCARRRKKSRRSTQETDVCARADPLQPPEHGLAGAGRRRFCGTMRTFRSSTSPGADGSFERRHVTLGSRVGDQYEITAGLKAGDQVVGDGALFLQFQQNQ